MINSLSEFSGYIDFTLVSGDMESQALVLLLAACRRDLALLGKAPLVVILAVKMQGRAPLIGEKRL